MGSIILQITQYIDCTWRIQKYSSMSNNADESQKCMECLYCVISFAALVHMSTDRIGTYISCKRSGTYSRIS
jgi:hypothetical protein